MNAKQEAERYIAKSKHVIDYGIEVIENLLKELEATERKLAIAEKENFQRMTIMNEQGIEKGRLLGKLAEAEKVVEGCRKYVDSGEHSFILNALSDYEASKEYISQEGEDECAK